jgi:ABC-type transport system involved in cytochrome c biogenesis permease subunit
MLSNILFHLILLAYLFATLLFWLHLSLRQHWLLQGACVLLGSGFGLQTGLLGFLLYSQRFLLRDNFAASMAILSWAIVAVYGIALWRYRIAALGSLAIPLAFLAAAYAGVPVLADTPLLPVLHFLWLGLHVVLALLGYAALTLTFCAGVVYLMQEHQLKSKRPGTLYHRLPSLMLLDEVNARALVLGFPLLTQGIITGSVWAKHMYGSYLHWHLTSLPLLLTWLLYGVLLGGRRTLGWQGKKAAVAAVGGFVVVVASYFVHTL